MDPNRSTTENPIEYGEPTEAAALVIVLVPVDEMDSSHTGEPGLKDLHGPGASARKGSS